MGTEADSSEKSPAWPSTNYGLPLSGLTPMTNASPFDTTTNHVNGNAYDARGNTTQVGTGVGVSYDAENRQIQTVDANTGLTINYVYDGLGQRVEQQIAGGATTIYIHDALGQLAAEYNNAGLTPPCTTCYLSYDQLGSVRLITDENQLVVGRHDYLPFGEEIPSGWAGRDAADMFGVSANVTQMFTGQERDGGSATLDYFNARHLSAVLERFTQPDPGNAGADILNPQSWNGYGYVLGNPLGNVDPSGMCTIAFAGVEMSAESNSVFGVIANALGAVQAYPYANLDLVGSLVGVALAPLGDNSEQVAAAALNSALRANSGKVDILAYSGGAGAFSAAYNRLSSADQSRIGNILYISPGANGSIAVNGTTSMVRGNDAYDAMAMAGTQYPFGLPTSRSNCNHKDVACLSNTATAIEAFNSMEANGACPSQSIFQLNPFRFSVMSTVGYGGGGASNGGGVAPPYFVSFPPIITYGAEGTTVSSPGGVILALGVPRSTP